MNVAEFVSDDDARDRRLAAIRARRGTPERLAQIEALEAGKARKEDPQATAESKVVAAMRRFGIEKMRAVTGEHPTRGHGETYSLANGTEFHLRTRQRDVQGGGWIRYWFGIRDHLWRPEDFFVLVCEFDFVLVVPVVEWLPHFDRFSVSSPGTSQQARQPHIYWRGTSYELREASTSVSLTLDVRRWVDNFALLG